MLSEAMSDLNGTLTARFTSVDGAVDSGMSENSSYVWNGEVTNFPLSPVRMAFSGKVAVKRTSAWVGRCMSDYMHSVRGTSRGPSPVSTFSEYSNGDTRSPNIDPSLPSSTDKSLTRSVNVEEPTGGNALCATCLNSYQLSVRFATQTFQLSVKSSGSHVLLSCHKPLFN